MNDIDDLCPFGRRPISLQGRKLSAVEKTWLADRVLDETYSLNALSILYEVSKHSLKYWVKSRRNGKTIHDAAGKPTLLTPEGMERLKKRMTSSMYKMPTKEFQQAVYEERMEDARNEGKSPEAVEKPSRKALKRLEIELNVQTKKAEYTTEARAKATASLRNGVSQAVMSSWALNKIGVPELKLFNADGTSVTVGAVGSEFSEVKVIKVERDGPSEEEEKKSFNQVIPQKGEKTWGLYTIKAYVLINAAGYVFDVVYVIQDESMDAKDMDKYRVAGLGISTGLGNQGYIVFMKSRCGNEAFYKWITTEYINNAIDAIHKDFPEVVDMPSMLKIDGEPIQLSPFALSEVQHSLAQKNTYVGKSPHSCTAIYQECDCNNIFRAGKTANRKLNEKTITIPFLKVRITEVFKQHNAKMNPPLPSLPSPEDNAPATKKRRKKADEKEAVQEKKKGLTPYHTNFGICGILRVQLAFQMTLRPHMIRESFQKAGSFPFNLPQIINQLRGKPVSQAERDAIKTAMQELVQRFHDKGELSEADFEEFGIREDDQGPYAKPRDERVIYQRRALLLTHTSVRAKEYPESLSPYSPPAAPVPLPTPDASQAAEVVEVPPQDTQNGKRKRKPHFKTLN